MKNTPENELLSAYLDGELTAEEHAEVEQLLASSAEARQLLDDMRTLSSSLQSLPQQTLGIDLSEQVLRLAKEQTASGNGTGNGAGNGADVDASEAAKPMPKADPAARRGFFSPRNVAYIVATAAAVLIFVFVYQPEHSEFDEIAKISDADAAKKNEEDKTRTKDKESRRWNQAKSISGDDDAGTVTLADLAEADKKLGKDAGDDKPFALEETEEAPADEATASDATPLLDIVDAIRERRGEVREARNKREDAPIRGAPILGGRLLDRLAPAGDRAPLPEPPAPAEAADLPAAAKAPGPPTPPATPLADDVSPKKPQAKKSQGSKPPSREVDSFESLEGEILAPEAAEPEEAKPEQTRPAPLDTYAQKKYKADESGEGRKIEIIKGKQSGAAAGGGGFAAPAARPESESIRRAVPKIALEKSEIEKNAAEGPAAPANTDVAQTMKALDDNFEDQSLMDPNAAEAPQAAPVEEPVEMPALNAPAVARSMVRKKPDEVPVLPEAKPSAPAVEDIAGPSAPASVAPMPQTVAPPQIAPPGVAPPMVAQSRTEFGANAPAGLTAPQGVLVVGYDINADAMALQAFNEVLANNGIVEKRRFEGPPRRLRIGARDEAETLAKEATKATFGERTKVGDQFVYVEVEATPAKMDAALKQLRAQSAQFNLIAKNEIPSVAKQSELGLAMRASSALAPLQEEKSRGGILGRRPRAEAKAPGEPPESAATPAPDDPQKPRRGIFRGRKERAGGEALPGDVAAAEPFFAGNAGGIAGPSTVRAVFVLRVIKSQAVMDAAKEGRPLRSLLPRRAPAAAAEVDE